jgi:hypothetical protein
MEINYITLLNILYFASLKVIVLYRDQGMTTFFILLLVHHDQ